jgi:hypothetical protein
MIVLKNKKLGRTIKQTARTKTSFPKHRANLKQFALFYNPISKK